MPKKLKCYTKQRKDGSSYTTCNKDIKENKPKPKPKPKPPPKPPPITKDLFFSATNIITEKSKMKYDSFYTNLTTEELRSGFRKYGREKKLKMTNINSATKISLLKALKKKPVPKEYFVKKKGKFAEDIDGKVDGLIDYINKFNKTHKQKIALYYLKKDVFSKAKQRRLDRLFDSRAKITKTLREYNNNVSAVKQLHKDLYANIIAKNPVPEDRLLS